MKLCINIDHVATLREARKGREPDPVHAAVLCELAGANGITFHLREDRRHINERDVRLLKEVINIKLNMEMACTKDMIRLAKMFKPDQITLVPEKRRELTTEGGLDVKNGIKNIKKAVKELSDQGISVSLFINPLEEQIDKAYDSGAECVELHTGEYANAVNKKHIQKELSKLKKAAICAHNAGLKVYAGHGLNYRNVEAMFDINYIEELNIGYSIISRSVFAGIGNAVKEMLYIIHNLDSRHNHVSELPPMCQ